MSATFSQIERIQQQQEKLREAVKRRRLGDEFLADTADDAKPIAAKPLSSAAAHACTTTGPVKSMDEVLDPAERKLLQKLIDLKVPLSLQPFINNDDLTESILRATVKSLQDRQLLVAKENIVISMEKTAMRALLVSNGLLSTVQKSAQDLAKTPEMLLAVPSVREAEKQAHSQAVMDLLTVQSAKEKSLYERLKSQGGSAVREFCEYVTKRDCARERKSKTPCTKLHFVAIVQPHTDPTLGDCNYLNGCFNMKKCAHLHYKVDEKDAAPRQMTSGSSTALSEVTPPQWISCDVRKFDFSVLGKFTVVMADPPWDIHMQLPYGTLSDDEMRTLQIPKLQDDGIIFLWVTGRAIELGHECLALWGYKHVDELIWVKVNQLQNLIRSGRTGHWLNHSKEHCLVGIKGNPSNINRYIDTDVIVAEVRDTSHKPDEVYGLIERLAPGLRKIEIFGRQHNTQPGWMTLGNQLDGVRIVEPDVQARFDLRYPTGL